jgi:hypothetical protein
MGGVCQEKNFLLQIFFTIIDESRFNGAIHHFLLKDSSVVPVISGFSRNYAIPDYITPPLNNAESRRMPVMIYNMRLFNNFYS